MSDRRSWLPIAVASGLVLAGLAVAVLVRPAELECATSVEAASPLLSPDGMAEQPDERLDVLRAAVATMGPPVGPVLAGVGYDYDQWLHLYGVQAGLLAFTKNNAPVTLLDDNTLRPRWALEPTRKRIAWDASADSFAVLGLAADKATRVGVYDLRTGAERWCVAFGAGGQRDGEPVSSLFTEGGDLIVALPVGDGIGLKRLGAEDGAEVWDIESGAARAEDNTVARADFLGQLDADTIVAGGVEEFRLAQPPVDAPAAAVISGFALADGERLWSWSAPRGTTAHVVGTLAGPSPSVVAMSNGPSGVRIFALSAQGKELWKVQPKPPVTDATLRGDTLVLRFKGGLIAYDARTGEQRWFRGLPTDRTYFPYGFTLGQAPSLDEKHVLLPTTTDLQVLDLATGRSTGYPLPTDGVSTTYWPYQLAVSPGLVGIVTNTGGVVADRDPDVELAETP